MLMAQTFLVLLMFKWTLVGTMTGHLCLIVHIFRLRVYIFFVWPVADSDLSILGAPADSNEKAGTNVRLADPDQQSACSFGRRIGVAVSVGRIGVALAGSTWRCPYEMISSKA